MQSEPNERVVDAVVVHLAHAEAVLRRYRKGRRHLRRWVGGVALFGALLVTVWRVPGTGAGVVVWGGMWAGLLLTGGLAVPAYLDRRKRRDELREVLADLVAARRDAAAALEEGDVGDADRPELEAVLEEADELLEGQSAFSATELEPTG
jgi:hypothetical protein